jgi:lysophospholipase L1-like esterase
MRRIRSLLLSFALTVASVAVCLAAGEFVLRIKNSSMKTYDIEMWRYAKELKHRSSDPDLGFDHLRSKSALLQSVRINLNEMGLRGGPLQPPADGERRILFLGGSITLGWGVPEDQTVETQLQEMLRASGDRVQVLNGGVGNYNAVRYVSRFFKELTELKPSDIVVQYFLRDAEALDNESGNFLLRNSELAVTLWIAYHRLLDRQGEQSLFQHYRKVYEPAAPGFLAMREKLHELAAYAKAQGIGLYMAMTPDIHNLVDYKFGFIHDQMRQIADEEGYAFIDLLPVLLGYPPESLYAMPGDPHPNALGHKLMAQTIFHRMVEEQKEQKVDR